MTVAEPTGPRGLAQRLRARAPGVAWLTLVWVLLWGTFTALSVVGGVLVAVAVTALIRLPLAPDRLPVRPLALLRLVGNVGWQLLLSNTETSWQTLRYGARARGAVLALPLLTRSDRVATVVANAISLTPGTMVLHLDQRTGTWYLYALGPRDRAAAERMRRQAARTQRRVIAALGSAEERAEVERLGRPV